MALFTSGVYVIQNTRNGCAYVGFSCDVMRRWRHHREQLHDGRHHNRSLQEAWNLDGADAFEFKLLEEVDGHDALVAREKFHCAMFAETYNGGRLGCGAIGGSFIHPPEVRERLRQARLGKVVSEETRKRLSQARKGKKFPNHGDALRGRKLSLETRAKMSIARRKRVLTESEKDNLRRANVGRVFSPEWRAKISAAKRGKPHWSKRLGQECLDEVQPVQQDLPGEVDTGRSHPMDGLGSDCAAVPPAHKN